MHKTIDAKLCIEKGMKGMDLLQLRYFRVVARAEHMTRAAEELSIAQPSLSKTIGRLEAELGVPLFDRQGRQLRLNRFGRAFLARVEPALRGLDEGRREVRDLAGLARGEVRVAAPSLHWLPDLVGGFLAAHPAVRVRLFQQAAREMRRQLDAGDIDLYFSSVHPDRPGVEWRPLHTAEILLVVPPGHRFVGRGSVPLREVAGEGVVIGKAGDELRDAMEAYCRQAGFALGVVCEADEPAAIRGFVDAGLGVAFIPAWARPPAGDASGTWLRVTDPVCPHTLGLAWDDDHYLSQAARAFREFAVAYFAAPENEGRSPAPDVVP